MLNMLKVLNIRQSFSRLASFGISKYIRNGKCLIGIPSCTNYLINVTPWKSKYQFDRKEKYFLVAGVLTYLGLKEKSPEEKESELINMMKIGVLQIQKGEFKKADKILHIALQVAQEQSNADAVTYIYDLLANLAFETGEYQKAEKLFIVVMQRTMGAGITSDDNKIIHMSLKLAKIYEFNKLYEKAEEGYRFCIDNLETKVSEKNDLSEDTFLLWAMSLDFYAHYLLNQKRNKEALECFKKALDKCSETYGREHEQIVILLNDLGTVTSILGDHAKATEYLQEAVKIGEKLPDFEDLGSIYVNLGQLYLLQKMYPQARTACSRGKKAAEKARDSEAIEEASICLREVKAAIGRE